MSFLYKSGVPLRIQLKKFFLITGTRKANMFQMSKYKTPPNRVRIKISEHEAREEILQFCTSSLPETSI